MFHKSYFKFIILTLLLMISNAGATTIIVPDNYASIQGAINAANVGDTIEVHSGTYYENVNINKKLTLRGIGMPVVNAGNLYQSGSAITLSVDGIVLEGFTATGGGSSEAGIKVRSNNNILSGNNASSNNYYGILLQTSSNNTLIGNTANSNYLAGIHLQTHSNNNTLIGNIANSNTNKGIYLYLSTNNTLNGNNASNNSYGIHLEVLCNNNTLNGNNASNNNYLGISLYISNNNTLIGNIANSNRVDGIILEGEGGSNHNTLSENYIISNKRDGIFLGDGSNNKIFNNIFNNTINVYFSRINIFTWNITKTPNLNIIGGSYLGGNFWAYPNGTGFSQTCINTDGDGFCDSPYVLDAINIDYLPLVLPSIRYINGTVKDNSTGNNLAGVTISANSTLSTMSDETGFYSFAVTDNTYNLISTINDIRFYTNTTTVSTAGKAVVILDIEMVRKPTGNITGSVTR